MTATRRVLVLAVFVAAGAACGAGAGEEVRATPTRTTVASPTTSPASTLPETTSSASTLTETTSAPSPVSVSDAPIPKGRVSARPGDVIVVRDDGDVWMVSGATDDAAPRSYRLADLADPRERSSEGPGANRVDAIAGPVDGVVYYTDCCEPAVGNLYGLAAPEGERRPLAHGGRVALRPDGRALATISAYALTVLDLTTGRVTTRSVGDPASQIAGEADVIWSADGRSLIVLDAQGDRLRLHRFLTSGALELTDTAEVPISPRPTASWVHFAGRGPDGTLVVASRGPDATRFLAFDVRTLAATSPSVEGIEAPVSSVQLGPDGRSVLWVADGMLTFRDADGRRRDTGPGIAAAWFAAG